MPSAPVIVYNAQMGREAFLENAFSIGYEMPLNGLWTASFSLPATDPKNAECLPLRFVEIYDGRDRVELFRILPARAQRSSDGMKVTYQCEHVLGTLIDDVLFQHHTIGNLGVYTSDVLSYILSKQTVERWQLGTVDFQRQFEYNWDNETLLAALISVPRPFEDDYMWTWDTTTFPWTLNLVPPSDEVLYIRYGVNMQGIERTIDPSNVCNRLYALGYGEGVNQLTFADINGGKPYVEDIASQEKYGIISRVWADRRYEHPETLLARSQVLLNEMKAPRLSYKVQASETHSHFKTGANVRMQDDDLAIDFTARVVNVRKRDIYGAPGAVEIEIANRTQDIAGYNADLANRQRINEVYAQGATNIDSHDFADNCDPDHPAKLKFYIPDGAERINKVMLSYECESFRAYSKAIEGGGGIATSTAAGGGIATTTADGGGIATTTANGGGTVVSSESEDYDHTHGYFTGLLENPNSTITDEAGGHYHALQISEDGEHWHEVDGDETDEAGAHQHPFSVSDTVDDHIHLVGQHRHHQNLIPHTHDVPIPSHDHDLSLPNHKHNITLPDHTHNITLPNHTHGILYGIFEGPTPTAVTVKVDGNEIAGLGTSVQDVDIIPYLSKDGGGRVQRGWHTIEIAPNSLGRIVSSVVTQIFVQSRGGGNY